jgi:adenylate cyclase
MRGDRLAVQVLMGQSVHEAQRWRLPVAPESEPDRRPIGEQMWGVAAAFTASDVAAEIGRDESYVRRAWRQLGLPDPEGNPVFFPADIELLRVHSEATELFGAESVEHMTRAIGVATRSITEATIALLPGAYGNLSALPPNEAERVLSTATTLLPQLLHAIPAVLVHQSRATLGFEAPRPSTGSFERTLAVGFCDLVGSTRQANESPVTTMQAITQFETFALEVIAQRHGRLVKFVGDEVMFATRQLEEAREIALEILQWVVDHGFLPHARAGLAYGSVISRDGDLYGSTVNLAARLVAHAEPDTVVIADDTGDETVTVKGFEQAIRVRTYRRASSAL